MASLVLASSSPQRRLLLEAAGFEFVVREPHVDEGRVGAEAPRDMVARLATLKAGTVHPPGNVVLGVDTVVVVDGGAVLGKPGNEATAVEMLLRLAGSTHSVLSGWAVLQDGRPTDHGVAESIVTMRRIEVAEAEAYAVTGEPIDKAGGYALQGRGGAFVAAIAGSRSNVIGLPLRAVVPALRRAGVAPSTP